MPDEIHPKQPDVAKISEAIDEKKLNPDAAKDEELEFTDQVELERKVAELQGLTQDIEERKIYARKIFRLIACWVAGVFIILMCQGFLGRSQQTTDKNGSKLGFNLSDSVLIAVVSGTTASVIGIFLVVANYLFPKR